MLVTRLERHFVEVTVNRDCLTRNCNFRLTVGLQAVDFFESDNSAAQLEFACQNIF